MGATERAAADSPKTAVLGSNLSSSERVAARKALGRLDIQCADRRTQEDISPDESVFIVVGNDLAAAERLAKRCRLQRRPAHRPLWTETDCSRRVAGGRRASIVGIDVLNSKPPLRDLLRLKVRSLAAKHRVQKQTSALYIPCDARCNQH